METSIPGDDQSRVEQLLRQAHVHRMRQQWAAAEALCRQALELAPEDPIGIEMLGDLLVEKGNLQSALEQYRKAFAAQPGKAILEEKIARTVLTIAEEEQERAAAQLMLNSPVRKSERKRNATVATLLSLLCPGVGQLFLGQHVKGGILLGAGLLSLWFGGADLFKLLAVVSGASLPPGEGVNQFLAALGILGLLLWLYGLLDASAQAGKSARSLDV